MTLTLTPATPGSLTLAAAVRATDLICGAATLGSASLLCSERPDLTSAATGSLTLVPA